VTQEYEYAIGADAGSLEYLFDLDIKPPRQSYQPFSKWLDLPDGSRRGAGFPIALWEYAYLSDAEATQLRALCPNGSGEVHVRTLNDSLVWHTYRAMMTWPEDEPEVEIDHRMRVTIRFRILEQVA